MTIFVKSYIRNGKAVRSYTRASLMADRNNLMRLIASASSRPAARYKVRLDKVNRQLATMMRERAMKIQATRKRALGG